MGSPLFVSIVDKLIVVLLADQQPSPANASSPWRNLRLFMGYLLAPIIPGLVAHQASPCEIFRGPGTGCRCHCRVSMGEQSIGETLIRRMEAGCLASLALTYEEGGILSRQVGLKADLQIFAGRIDYFPWGIPVAPCAAGFFPCTAKCTLTHSSLLSTTSVRRMRMTLLR